MPLLAQNVLDQGILAPNGRQIYGYHNGKVYEFMPDNGGGYHGYPVPGTEVPAQVLRTMRDQGTISSAQYGRLIRGR